MNLTILTTAVQTETVGLQELTDEQLETLISHIRQIQKQRADERLQAKLEDDWATDGGQNCGA
jgi:hypothetical protein